MCSHPKLMAHTLSWVISGINKFELMHSAQSVFEFVHYA